MTDRLPPCDLQAERATLGSVMIDDGTFAGVRAILGPDIGVFHADPAHQRIYAAMIQLAHAGSPIDQTTVAAALGDSNEDRIEVLDLLRRCSDVAVSAANAEYYAKIVAGHHHRRLAISQAERLARAAYDGNDDAVRAVRDEIRTSSVAAEPGDVNRVRIASMADFLAEPEALTPWLIEGLLVV